MRWFKARGWLVLGVLPACLALLAGCGTEASDGASSDGAPGAEEGIEEATGQGSGDSSTDSEENEVDEADEVDEAEEEAALREEVRLAESVNDALRCILNADEQLSRGLRSNTEALDVLNGGGSDRISNHYFDMAGHELVSAASTRRGCLGELSTVESQLEGSDARDVARLARIHRDVSEATRAFARHLIAARSESGEWREEYPELLNAVGDAFEETEQSNEMLRSVTSNTSS